MRIHAKKPCLFAVLMTTLLTLAACGGEDGGLSKVARQAVREVASVIVTPDTWDARRGQQQQLTAKAYNVHGYPVAGVQFVWQSSAADVAQVDTNGNVTVLFVAGSADVTATADGKTGTAAVTVTPVVSSITVSPGEWSANRIGQRQLLTATALDAAGDPIADVRFHWESSATDVIKVDQGGAATAYSAGLSDVAAMAEGRAGVANLGAASEVESASAELMHTVWFARSDDAPALIVDGNLTVLSDMFCFHQFEERWTVCPSDAAFPADSAVERNDYAFLTPFPNPPDATTPWEFPEVAKFQWEGDRIGVLSDMSAGLGTFRVLDRNSEWFTIGIANVADFQLDFDRIGLVDDQGALVIRDNTPARHPFLTCAPGAVCPQVLAWTTIEPSDVRQFQLYRGLVGVLLDDGTFRIYSGNGGAPMAQSSPGPDVDDFAIEGLTIYEPGCFDPLADPPCIRPPVRTSTVRVGTILGNRDLLVQDGLADADWITVEQGVRRFQLAGDFIGVLREDNTFGVRQGASGPWAASMTDVREFELQARLMGTPFAYVRIGVVLNNGDFLVKEGSSGNWVNMATNVQHVQFQENYIGAVFGDAFAVKEGINGEWRQADLNGGVAGHPANVSQIRVVVDVPVPPVRTTPSTYRITHRACATEGDACYPERTLGAPSDFYGRFCGGGLPEFNARAWSVAINRGPVDTMDSLCVHHDAAYPVIDSTNLELNAVSWYPETPSGLDSSATGPTYLCVVRYGLHNAKLTSHGRVLDKNERSNWGELDELYGTIYWGLNSFWTGAAAGCPDVYNLRGDLVSSMVADFTNATVAKHNRNQD